MVLSRLITTAVAAVALSSSIGYAAPLKRDDTLRFDFGNTKVRGVNLGKLLPC